MTGGGDTDAEDVSCDECRKIQAADRGALLVGVLSGMNSRGE